MPQGLITSLLIKLTLDFWYLALLALLFKLVLIRITVTPAAWSVFLIWLTGNITFYCMACLSGLIFSSAGFYFIPIIMFVISALGEIGFMSVMFRISAARLWPAILLGNGLFFSLLFLQMT
jgi:hypothetical protein